MIKCCYACRSKTVVGVYGWQLSWMRQILHFVVKRILSNWNVLYQHDSFSEAFVAGFLPKCRAIRVQFRDVFLKRCNWTLNGTGRFVHTTLLAQFLTRITTVVFCLFVLHRNITSSGWICVEFENLHAEGPRRFSRPRLQSWTIRSTNTLFCNPSGVEALRTLDVYSFEKSSGVSGFLWITEPMPFSLTGPKLHKKFRSTVEKFRVRLCQFWMSSWCSSATHIAMYTWNWGVGGMVNFANICIEEPNIFIQLFECHLLNFIEGIAFRTQNIHWKCWVIV